MDESDVVKDYLSEQEDFLEVGQKSCHLCPCPWNAFPTWYTVGSQDLAHSRSSASQRRASTSWLAFWWMSQLRDDELLMFNHLASCQKCGFVSQRTVSKPLSIPSLPVLPRGRTCKPSKREPFLSQLPSPCLPLVCVLQGPPRAASSFRPPWLSFTVGEGAKKENDLLEKLFPHAESL